MFIIGDLPEPEAPMMATNSPAWIIKRHSTHGMHLHFTAIVGLAKIFEVDDGRAHLACR